jgi:hypothetical protein
VLCPPFPQSPTLPTLGLREITSKSRLHHRVRVFIVDVVKIEHQPACSAKTHQSRGLQPVGEPSIELTARIFRALGEPARIRLVARLAQGEACVTELAELEGGPRRKGKRVLYFLSDQHMLWSSTVWHMPRSNLP